MESLLIKYFRSYVTGRSTFFEFPLFIIYWASKSKIRELNFHCDFINQQNIVRLYISMTDPLAMYELET